MDTPSVLALIGSVSPSLAAYHHLRLAKSDPDSGDRCERCGHHLLAGTSSHARVVRSPATPQNKRRSRPRPGSPIVRCLRRTCATCGHDNNTPLHPIPRRALDHGSHVTSPSPSSLPSMTPRTHGTDQTPSPDPHPPCRAHPSPPPPLTSPQQTHPPTRSRKSRTKHKAGLQEMLARNKERQHEAPNRSSSGLATFLHSL